MKRMQMRRLIVKSILTNFILVIPISYQLGKLVNGADDTLAITISVLSMPVVTYISVKMWGNWYEKEYLRTYSEPVNHNVDPFGLCFALATLMYIVSFMFTFVANAM